MGRDVRFVGLVVLILFLSSFGAFAQSNYAITTTHYMASDAADRILAQGGTAADAQGDQHDQAESRCHRRRHRRGRRGL